MIKAGLMWRRTTVHVGVVGLGVGEDPINDQGPELNMETFKDLRNSRKAGHE